MHLIPPRVQNQQWLLQYLLPLIRLCNSLTCFYLNNAAKFVNRDKWILKDTKHAYVKVMANPNQLLHFQNALSGGRKHDNSEKRGCQWKSGVAGSMQQ